MLLYNVGLPVGLLLVLNSLLVTLLLIADFGGRVVLYQRLAAWRNVLERSTRFGCALEAAMMNLFITRVAVTRQLLERRRVIGALDQSAIAYS